MSNGSRARSDTNVAAFEAFFQGWLVRQERYLDELLTAQCEESSEDDLRELTTQVLTHYQQYYEEKSRVAQQNVFLVFSPHWLTSLERALLWITGFRPAAAFRLVADCVNDLSGEQSQRMNRLREETRVEARMLNDELAKIHENVAAPPLLELVRRRARLIEGEINGEREALETLRSDLESVVASADMLRTTTAAKVVEILNPRQSIKFLTAATRFQLRIRSWGMQRDAERQE